MAPDEPHKLSRRVLWDCINVASLERRWEEQENAIASTSEPWAPRTEDGDPSSWWPALQKCREVLVSNWDTPFLPYDAKGQLPFVDLWWPVRCFGAKSLQDLLAEIPLDFIFLEKIADESADGLLERLCGVTEQVLWERFKQTRTPAVAVLAHLGAGGDTNAPPLRDAYEAFIHAHRSDGLASLLTEYPVLGQLIGIVVTLWLQACEEMLSRIAADREILIANFSLTPDHRLTTLKQGLSDNHHGGRGVAILGFTTDESSNELRIVYKPKDMGVDAAYQQVLSDLNAYSSLPHLRILKIYAANGYGYMEYVPHQLCSDEVELRNFYTHAGRLLALLYVLGCTDCHHENLIACGEQLLLIDTETLLEPDLPDHIGEAAAQAPAVSTSLLQRRLQTSVLRSGLLPQSIVMGTANRAIDISAIGVIPPSEARQLRPGWLGLNSDGMMPGLVSFATELPTSLPVGIGASNPFPRHLESFCDGFESQCLDLQSQNRRFLSPDGLLGRFRGLPRRIVLRATRVYYLIQRQLLAPNALRSAFAQTMVLEQLARSFLLAEFRPLNWPVFDAELRQMRRLDIPFFTHNIDGDALSLGDYWVPEQNMDSHLVAELPGFIRVSSLTTARQRFQALSPEEIGFQLRLIRGTAAAMVMEQVPSAPPFTVNPEPMAGERKLVRASRTSHDPHDRAKQIASFLLDAAIVDSEGKIEWLGLDLEADGRSFRFGLVSNGLYGGTIGIACLLGRLHAHGLDQSLTIPGREGIMTAPAVTEAILRPLRELGAESRAEERLRWWRDQPLGINGCGGILLALQFLGEHDLVDVLLKSIVPRVLRNNLRLDLICGSAGLVGPLLRQKGEAAKSLALATGEWMLQQLKNHGAGSDPLQLPGLMTFTHGMAGVASALAALHAFSGEQHFLEAAAMALAEDRRRSDHKRVESSSLSGVMHTGTPGIALGRACLWGTALWDEQCLEEIEAVVLAMVAQPQLPGDSLCYGNLGVMTVLELFAEAPWFPDTGLQNLCQKAAQRFRDLVLNRCDCQMHDETLLQFFPTSNEAIVLPGFFTGVSGIGLALLEGPHSRWMVASLLTAGLWPRRPTEELPT